MKGFYGVVHKLLAPLARFIFNIKSEGLENEPSLEQGAYLICANHISIGDPIWLCAVLRSQQPHFMAKSELFKIPLLRGLIRALGAYPVNRNGADVSSIKNTINLMKSGKCVGMFPQGTRCPKQDPAQTAVKSGAGMIAVRSQVQVLPILIRTKEFKPTWFGRKTIIIGKPIPYENIKKMHEDHVEYSRISKYIFDEICGLDNCINNDKK